MKHWRMKALTRVLFLSIVLNADMLFTDTSDTLRQTLLSICYGNPNVDLQ